MSESEKTKPVSECNAFELCDMSEEDVLAITESMSTLGEFFESNPNFEDVCMKPLERLMISIAVACGVDAYRKGKELGREETKELRRICAELNVSLDKTAPPNETIH
tara:strand:+ start:1139 stop:1459 length:321 start_codon:yes stop_codon:yes gene_type:complete